MISLSLPGRAALWDSAMIEAGIYNNSRRRSIHVLQLSRSIYMEFVSPCMLVHGHVKLQVYNASNSFMGCPRGCPTKSKMRTSYPYEIKDVSVFYQVWRITKFVKSI